MRRRPIIILVCVYIVFLIWILVWQPKLGEKIFGWNEKVTRLKEQYEGETRFTGLVLEVEKRRDGARARIRLKKESGLKEEAEGILLYEEKGTGELQIGRWITIQGDLWWPEAATNPGQWDGEQYARIHNIDFYLRASKWEYAEESAAASAFAGGTYFAKLRSWFSKQIEGIWQGENSAIIKAMLLGDSGTMDSNTIELFRKGGISHIIAISGLHLTVIGEILGKILKRFQKPKMVQWEINGFLWLYTLLVGASVSTLRAAIMATIRTTAILLDREEDSLNTLALTAGILLIKQPLYILDAGFTLSFAALLGMKYGQILFMSIRILPYRIRRFMASSSSISLVTIPLSLWFFYEASVYGFLLNFWVIPCMEILLMGILTAIGLSWLHPALGEGIAVCADVLLMGFQKGSEIVSNLPGAVLRGQPQMYQMMALYGIWILVIWYYRKPYKRERRIQILLLGLILGMMTVHRTNFWRIIYLDVGQGDCAVIEWNQNVFLVDAGPEYETVLKPYLMQRGIRTIDGVIVSHTDWDHMEGVLLLSEDEDFVIKRLWYADEEVQWNENLLRLEQNVRNDGGEVQRVQTGYHFQTDGFSINVLSPGTQHESSNEGSIVAEIKIGEWNFLFPGDIGEETEKEILERWNDVDVLKVAHHGSGNSTSEVFLERIQPEIAVISCGRKNRYGHPHEKTIEKMKTHGIEYYVTAEQGAVWIEEENKQLSVRQYGLRERKEG